jgi:predicted PurR-regulated permease PerM
MENKADSRINIARYISWAALIIIGVIFIARIRNTMMLFGLAMLIAYLLRPVVDFFSGLTFPWTVKKIPRFYSILLVYILLASFITILAFILIPNATEQISNVIQSMPKIIESAQDSLDNIGSLFKNLQIPAEISKRVDEFFSSLTMRIGSFIEAMFKFFYNVLLSLISGVLFVLLSLLLAFFILSGEDKLMKNFYSLIPTDYQDDIKILLDEINSIFGKFIRGTSILIFIYGSITYVMFQAVIYVMQLGLSPDNFPFYKYALIASVVAGIFSFVPYAGCTLIVIISMILAFIQNPSPGYMTTIGLIALITNQLVDTFIKPKILGEALGVPTLFILFSIFAAGEIWGAWGLFIGIPLGVMLIPIIRFYHKRFLAYDLHNEVLAELEAVSDKSTEKITAIKENNPSPEPVENS